MEYSNIETLNVGIMIIEMFNVKRQLQRYWKLQYWDIEDWNIKFCSYLILECWILKQRMVVQLNRECLNKEFGNITLKQL